MILHTRYTHCTLSRRRCTDEVTQFNPIAGHGGNASVESATALVNTLRQVLEQSKGTKPTLASIEQMFATTQQIRQARTNTLKEASHEQQRAESLDTRFHEFAAFHLLPLTDTEDVTFNFSRNMPMAEKLESPSLKTAPRLIPYKDDLLSAPKARGMNKWYFIGFYLLVAALTHYGMWIRSAHYGLGDHIGTIMQTGQFVDDPRFTLKRTYAGIKIVDQYLAFLAAVFMTGVNNWDHNFGMIQLYFLGMLVQPIAVYSVEAFRKRNLLSPISLYVLVNVRCRST